MLLATMPEATVNENNNSLTPECKVWLPSKRQLSPPSFYAVRSKDADKLSLCQLVVCRPDRCHYSRTLLLGNRVGHAVILN
jgi:hypothetical protein